MTGFIMDNFIRLEDENKNCLKKNNFAATVMMNDGYHV